MSPSERLNLIKKISNKLGAEDYYFIDLTLRLFGLPTADEWSGGGPVPYVAEMISTAPALTLVQLAQHVNNDISYEKPTKNIVIADCWGVVANRKDTFKLFISHLSRDKDFAIELRDNLRRYGISGFVAHVDIEPTREWLTEIESALQTADALTALLKPDFKNSCWTDQEIGIAIGRGILVLPVRLGLDPYGFIGKVQALPGYGGDAKRIAEGCFQQLSKHRLTQQKIFTAFVEVFEQSYSFQNAKENMGLLEQLTIKDTTLLKRIKQAPVNNGQVADSIGVPKRIANYVANMNSS